MVGCAVTVGRDALMILTCGRDGLMILTDLAATGMTSTASQRLFEKLTQSRQAAKKGADSGHLCSDFALFASWRETILAFSNRF